MMKKNTLYLLIAVFFVSFISACAVNKVESLSSPSEINVIRNIEIIEEEGRTVVAIDADAPITYTAFKLTEPVRVVVDVTAADVSTVMAGQEVEGRVVSRVSAVQFGPEEGNIGRIEIELRESVEYTIEKEGSALRVVVNEGTGFDSKPADSLVDAAAIVEEEELPVESERSAVDYSGAILPRASGKGSDEKAKYIADIGVEGDENGALVFVQGEGFIGDYNAFKMENPPRIVIDLLAVKNLYRKNIINSDSQFLNSVRVGQHEDKVRLVLDVPDIVDYTYEIKKVGKLLLVGLGDAAIDEVFSNAETKVAEVEVAEVEVTEIEVAEAEVAEAEVAEAEVAEAEVAEAEVAEAEVAEAEVAEAEVEVAEVTAINFKQMPGLSQISISITNEAADFQVSELSTESLAVDIANANIPKKLQRSLDTSEFESPVRLISSYQMDKGIKNKVRVIVSHAEGAEYDIKSEGSEIYVDFVRESSVDLPEEVFAVVVEDEKSEALESAELVEEQAIQKPSATMSQGYADAASDVALTEIVPVLNDCMVNTKSVFDYKEVDIHNLLRLIADTCDLNLVAGNDVKGKITLSLHDVSLADGLDIALDRLKLGRKIERNNLLIIAPKAVLKMEERDKLKSKEELELLRETEMVDVTLEHADVDALAAKLTFLLSKHRQATIIPDKDLNQITVIDVPERVVRIVERIKVSDRLAEPPQQVLIEARIVEIDASFSRDIGVQWGAGKSGNVNGDTLNAGIGMGGAYALNPPTVGYNPDAIGATGTYGGETGAGGAAQFAFGNINNTFSLDLKLSALESKGVSKIISRPRIVTIDGEEAEIQQGFSIPFETTSESGTKTEFIDANLNLTVTPNIRSDGIVKLDIKAAKNEPDYARTGAGGKPSINKKEASTKVYINDGDTTVIGGIFTNKKSTSTKGVPWLSSIPILGHLFKSSAKIDDKAEILIFITPRIIKPTRSR